MKIIAVYGSLKKGKYNHTILEGSKLLGKSTIQCTMYSLGSYPAIIMEGEDVHEAEIYEVSEEVYNPILRMELGAGYKEEKMWFSVGANTQIEARVYVADDRLEDYCKKTKSIIKKY